MAQFEMNEQEANLIIAGLGKLPFESVVALITKLQMQYQAQLNPPEQPPQEPVT